MAQERAARTQLLLRLARSVAEARSPEEIFPLLAAATQDPCGVGAAAAASLRLNEKGEIALVAGRGLPVHLDGWAAEFDAMDPELGRTLLAAWTERSPGARDVRTLPLVSGGSIFGALVIFSDADVAFDGEQASFCEGIADLCAVAMERLIQHDELRLSNAELRASREALAKSEKMRALGEMAAGISHDIKNILNPLSLELQLLRRRIEKGPGPALEVVARMEDAIRSGVEVVERLRAFSRQEPEREAEPVDLADVLHTAVELCRPRLKSSSGIEIETEVADAPRVRARRAEMVTAVVNLVFNAIEAIGGAGLKATVKVRTGAQGSEGFIEVADDGPGMSPEVQTRVFEPFFTTKEQGTGLGLAMVYAFVKRHGGQITVDTHVGQGTRIRLRFPAIRVSP